MERINQEVKVFLQNYVNYQQQNSSITTRNTYLQDTLHLNLTLKDIYGKET